MIRLASKNQCTGCAACQQVCGQQAISMVEDTEGFRFPYIDKERCVECHLCEKTCPVITIHENNNFANPEVYAMWSNKDRRVSSSGGAFSAFARVIINKGGVVFGAYLDEDMILRHIGIDSLDDLEKLRGSKYLQSELNNTFVEIKGELKKDKYVLFCGTPCQVAGLKTYLRVGYDKLYTLDLTCHGVPSVKIFNSYLDKLKTRHGSLKIKGIEFRRRDGWGFAPSILTSHKFIRIYDEDNLYMCAFDKAAIFRKSCANCQFAKIQRQGDCMIADFWGIGRHGKPFKKSTLKGVSLVFINNDKGASLFNEINDCYVEKRTLEEAIIENFNITHPSRIEPRRDEIIKAFLNPALSLGDIDKKFNLVDHSLKGKIKKYASKYHIFDAVKVIYNFYKTL